MLATRRTWPTWRRTRATGSCAVMSPTASWWTASLRRTASILWPTWPPGEVYNIGAGEEKTNLDLARTILGLLGKPESLITFVKDRPGHDRRYAISATKINHELGWKPKRLCPRIQGGVYRWFQSPCRLPASASLYRRGVVCLGPGKGKVSFPVAYAVAEKVFGPNIWVETTAESWREASCPRRGGKSELKFSWGGARAIGATYGFPFP